MLHKEPVIQEKLRTHHGAVDQDALTSRSPSIVLLEIKQTLNEMGLDFKKDGDYKLRCTRHKKTFRKLLRRPNGIYGDPTVDPGEEVRFSVEICRIKNLPGLYIVDMRRLRGNVWAYKFLYRSLLDTLHLGYTHY